MLSNLHSTPPSVVSSWPKPNSTGADTHGLWFPIVAGAMGGLTFLAICARLWARACIQRNVMLDDWLMLAALIPLGGLVVALSLSSELYGLNRHVWDNSTSNLIIQRKLNLAAEACFAVASCKLKCSVLFSYRRLYLRTVSRPLLLLIWLVLASIILYTIAFLVSLFLSCRPFSAYWSQFDPTIPATDYTCFNEALRLLTTTGISTLQTLLTTLLVAALVATSIHPTARQTLGLLLVFALGLTATLAGGARLYLLYRTFFLPDAYRWDTTWQLWRYNLLTVAEPLAGALAACLPALRLFFDPRSGQRSRGGAFGRSSTAPFDFPVEEETKSVSLSAQGPDGLMSMFVDGHRGFSSDDERSPGCGATPKRKSSLAWLRMGRASRGSESQDTTYTEYLERPLQSRDGRRERLRSAGGGTLASRAAGAEGMIQITTDIEVGPVWDSLVDFGAGREEGKRGSRIEKGTM